MRLSEVVRELIRFGEASRAYWDAELPRRHPHYPVIRDGEIPALPPPEDAEIEALLRKLPEDQLYIVVLLTYFGRGDFSADDLQAAYQSIKEAFPSRELVISQLTGEKTLAEYLTDATEEIQKRHIDLDGLKFEGAVTVH